MKPNISKIIPNIFLLSHLESLNLWHKPIKYKIEIHNRGKKINSLISDKISLIIEILLFFFIVYKSIQKDIKAISEFILAII